MKRFSGRPAVVVGVGNPWAERVYERLGADDAPRGGVEQIDVTSRRTWIAPFLAPCGPRVHVLVNCHFEVDWTTVEDSDYAAWEERPHQPTRAVGLHEGVSPLLTRRGSASVVHLGSIDGTLGNPGVPAYSAAKGGLVPLTHVMAHEFARYGIRVNCVARAAVAGHPGPGL